LEEKAPFSIKRLGLDDKKPDLVKRVWTG